MSLLASNDFQAVVIMNWMLVIISSTFCLGDDIVECILVSLIPNLTPTITSSGLSVITSFFSFSVAFYPNVIYFLRSDSFLFSTLPSTSPFLDKNFNLKYVKLEYFCCITTILPIFSWKLI